MTEDAQQRDSVVMYRNQIEALLACSPRDVKLILAMMRDYGMNGSEVDVPEHLQPLWIMFKFSIDENNRKFAETSEKRRQAAIIGNKQMRANASKRQQTQANASNSEQTQANASNSEQTQANVALNENENENENDINISLPNGSESNARARTRSESFKLTEYPETAEDVLAICQAINSPMSQEQAQAYIDNRIRADWHQGIGGTGRKIKLEGIPADIRLWVDRDKAEMNRNKQQINTKNEDRYDGIIGGEYIPKN